MATKPKLTTTTAAPRADAEWTGTTQTCADRSKGHLERRKAADGTYVTSWVPKPARRPA